jgi:hypothetical protein
MEVINARQQHIPYILCIHISCTEFHPNRALNVESMDRNLFPTLKSVTFTAPVFSQLSKSVKFRGRVTPVPNSIEM